MAIVKKADIAQVGVSVITGASLGLRQRIIDYCMARLIQTGLVAKSFAYGLIFDGSTVEYRKSVGKLKTLLQKYVIKKIPYISASKEDFIQVVGRESLKISILDTPYEWIPFKEIPEEKRPAVISALIPGTGRLNAISANSNALVRKIYLETLDDAKWMDRYARYLNYLARKNFVPFRITVLKDLIFDRDAIDAVYKTDTDRTKDVEIPYKITMDFCVEFGIWSMDGRRTSSEDYERFIREREEGNFSAFANERYWSFQRSMLSATHISYAYRCSIGKLFMHMDKGIRILTNLTRKASYGPSAFSFRTE